MLKYFMVRIDRLLQTIMLALIWLYRYFVSSLLGPRCRFEPTCSVYAEQAFKQYGFIRGSFLTLRRLMRCHPFHPGGHDPLP